MYIVRNITQGVTTECDAIETITVINGQYVPAEQSDADGFKAMTIVHVSPSEEYYNVEIFAYPDHILKGTEDEGVFEFVPDPE